VTSRLTGDYSQQTESPTFPGRQPSRLGGKSLVD